MAPTPRRKTTARSALRVVIDDIAPRVAALPVVSLADPGKKRAVEQDRADAAAIAIITHLRGVHGARVALGGSRQRISVAGVDVQTVMGTPNLLRLWLATARARLERVEFDRKDRS